MSADGAGTAFYVTRHPARESDTYFAEIGAYLHKRHGKQLGGHYRDA
jgi:hypothetical protein